MSFPLPKFSFLFLLPNIGNAISHSCSHPLINLGGGGQCALVDCPTLLTLICIFWFLYLSVVCHNLQNFANCGPGNDDKFFCVSQFVKFCKLWTRLRQHVFPFLKHYWSTKCHISYQNNHNNRNHWNHQIHQNYPFHKKTPASPESEESPDET